MEDDDGLELMKIMDLERDHWAAFEDGGGISIRHVYTKEYIVYQRDADRFFRFSDNYDPYNNAWADHGPGAIAVQSLNWTLSDISGGMTPPPANTDSLDEGQNNLYYTEDRVSNNPSVVANTAKNSYPLGDQLKLSTIQLGAEVNVNADWNELDTGSDAYILNKPVLSDVATSGSYNDLSGTPSLASVATTGDYSDLTGTPSLAAVATSGAYSDLSGTPSLAAVATSGDYSDLLNAPAVPPQFFPIAIVQTTTYTLTATDAGKYIRVVTASPTTITVPANVFTAEDEIIIEQAGDGQVTIEAGAGAFVLTSSANTTKTAEKYAVVGLKCVTATSFILTGERELA